MELRTGQIPAEVQYCLDCSVDYGHLTGGAHAAIWIYGDVRTIVKIHDDPRDAKGWEGTSNMLVRMEAYGQWLVSQMEPDIQDAMHAQTTVSLLKMMSEHGEYLARSLAEDMIWGGAMIHRHETRANRKGEVDPKLLRRLHSPKWVRRWVRWQRRETGFKHLQRVWDCAGRQVSIVEPRHFQIIDKLRGEQQARRAEYDRAWTRRIRDEQPVTAERRTAERRRRRVVVKAAAVAASLLGATAVSAFARGEPVVMATPEIILKVSLHGSVFQGGHGALNVSLHDTNDAFLSRMCIYQDKVPAFDQLAAMALFVQAGEIGKVIETGNLFSTAPAAFAHPLLQAKPRPEARAQQLEDEVDGAMRDLFSVVDRRGIGFDSHEVRNAWLLRYEREWGDLYRERVFIDVMGAQPGARAWALYKQFRSERRII